MSDYTQAPATKMLATNCVCCGRPLVDAVSVEMGIGPECRNGAYPDDIDSEQQKVANQMVHEAATAAEKGDVEGVIRIAASISEMGFPDLGDKVAQRFKQSYEKIQTKAKLLIEDAGTHYKVKTPFRRGDKEAFIEAWRAIPGRYYKDGFNYIPKAQRKALWHVLRTFFQGHWGKGPKGVFRVPKVAMTEVQVRELPEDKPVQQELLASIPDTTMDELCYIYHMELSPEHLTCDGERPYEEVEEMRTEIEKRLQAIFAKVGREVTMDEVNDWHRRNRNQNTWAVGR